MRFSDRVDAGRKLAAAVRESDLVDPVVLALPHGGVPVGYEVARELDAPLDVIVVRKLGVPAQPELAMGAIGEGGVRVLDSEVLRDPRLTGRMIEAVEAAQRPVLDREVEQFRSGRAPVALHGRTAVVVDDGIATGSTARAACQVARALGAHRVVLAVPVAPPNVEARLGDVADTIVCLTTPDDYFAVGQAYDDFTQVADDQVVALLRAAAAERSPRPAGRFADAAHGQSREVVIDADGARLTGHLVLPERASGLVLFAHGSGSSRHSPRNRYVADVLNGHGLGTLLFDLLTESEEARRANVFDVELLGERLQSATRWVQAYLGPGAPAIGYFGASTGAAAALTCAAGSAAVGAVVCRGGRVDLAGRHLGAVHAPTLLIVGSLDDAVVEINRRAQKRLGGPSDLVLVPGATHLFEEPGTLHSVALAATEWFNRYLGRPMAGASSAAGGVRRTHP